MQDAQNIQTYAVIQWNCQNGQHAVVLCTSDYNVAVNRIQIEALEYFYKASENRFQATWLPEMLTDIITNKRNAKVEVNNFIKTYGFRYTKDENQAGIQIDENATPAMAWLIVNVQNLFIPELTAKNNANRKIDEYPQPDETWLEVRQNVMLTLKTRYPSLDMNAPVIRTLIDTLTDTAMQDVKNGCDQDWSVDEAFRTKATNIKNLCG